MKERSSKKTLGVIHASILTAHAIQPFIDKYIPDVTVMHIVDDTIQRDNIIAGDGVIPKNNFYKFTQYAYNFQEAGVDLILLACSTFNQAVEIAQPMITTPMLQIDRPMMEKAITIGRKVGLLATLSTTVPSSTRLLRSVAEEAGIEIGMKISLCSEAFEEYQKGNRERHDKLLIDAARKLSSEVDVIVLAQLSMAAIRPLIGDLQIPVLDSGSTGFKKVKRILELA